MPYLAGFMAKEILKHKGKINQSFDLGLTKGEGFFDGKNIQFSFNRKEYIVSKEKLEKMAKHENSVFMINEEGVFRLAISGKGYYQLMFYHDSPTVEINGIRMHRVQEIHPFDDSRRKVELLNLKPEMNVLDTCMGLGYTAIWAKRKGAKVTTIEVSSEMLEIARNNPWSKELFEGIKIIQGDAFDVITRLKQKFDAVIHDPPRFGTAGHLYSLEFYKLLHEKTLPDSLLFHYVGRPSEKYQGKGIYAGVKKRLELAGWKIIDEKELGILCKRT